MSSSNQVSDCLHLISFCVDKYWDLFYLCTRLGLHTKMYPLNPKAMTVTELYGVLDPDTRDWTDGILSNIFRDINKPTDKQERRSFLNVINHLIK